MRLFTVTLPNVKIREAFKGRDPTTPARQAGSFAAFFSLDFAQIRPNQRRSTGQQILSDGMGLRFVLAQIASDSGELRPELLRFDLNQRFRLQVAPDRVDLVDLLLSRRGHAD